MEYICPQCGVKMVPVLCECREVAGIHIVQEVDGGYYHTRCGKRLPNTIMDSFKKAESPSITRIVEKGSDDGKEG